MKPIFRCCCASAVYTMCQSPATATAPTWWSPVPCGTRKGIHPANHGILNITDSSKPIKKSTADFSVSALFVAVPWNRKFLHLFYFAPYPAFFIQLRMQPETSVRFFLRECSLPIAWYFQHSGYSLKAHNWHQVSVYQVLSGPDSINPPNQHQQSIIRLYPARQLFIELITMKYSWNLDIV